MQDEFFKVYQSFWTGTIAEESLATRIIFLACIALADSTGEFVSTPAGIARKANVSLEDCENALTRLMMPDPYSTSPDEEGRRLLKDGNRWKVVNYAAYRAKKAREGRNAYMKEYMRKKRANTEPKNDDVSAVSKTVNNVRPIKGKERKGNSGNAREETESSDAGQIVPEIASNPLAGPDNSALKIGGLFKMAPAREDDETEKTRRAKIAEYKEACRREGK
jgi:hypothetical protein